MGWIYVINLLSLILSGTCNFSNSISTILQLNSYKKESYSTCQSGFLNGVDRYIYNGTLNTTSQDVSRRQNVYFQMQKSSLDGYTTVCKVTIYPSCANNQPLDECYCKNTPSSLVELFLNKTANIDYSNGSLQINWPSDATDDFSNVEQIPVIYTNHIENLKVGNVPVILDKCDFQLTATLMIQWCVTGLTSYGLTLNISSIYLQSENKCINYTYSLSSAESININFSVSYLEHDGCKRNGSTVCNSNNAPETTIIITTLNTTHGMESLFLFSLQCSKGQTLLYQT